MKKNNNNSPNNNNNQNYNYGNNNQNNEQSYNEYYQNNNQYYNQNQYFEQDANLGNYNQQYNDYNQEYNNYNQNYYNQYNEQNYNNYNQNFNQDNTKDNLEQTQYSNDYNSQNNNQYYNGYQQNNQNYKYSEQDYNNYQNNYNQNYQQDYPQNYDYTNHDYINAQNNYNQNYQQSNLNHVDSNYYQESTQNITTGQKTIGTYNLNQTNSNINGTEENKQTYASTQQNNFNNYQQNQNTYQNNNNQNREAIPPVPPIMNPKNFNNSPSNPKKKSKRKLVAIVSTLLGVVLLTGGGYYYYSKKAKTKTVNENEVYSSVIQKYKAAINNLDNADKSINVEALKAALKEKKNDDYIKYVFYDIDGNGRKELLISRNDKPNNPIDMYTFDKNNKVIRLFNSETIDGTILNKLGVDGSNNNSGSAVFKDKTIRIRKFDKDTGEYNFLKFSKDGNKLEKTNVITFTGLDTDDSKYKDITNKKEYNSKKEFNDTFPLPELLKFDNENWKSVKNFGEITNNNNNDNSQNKKPDNYEKAYATVLKDYQDAINKGKSDKQDINPVAISNYTVFGEKQVGKNFLNYGFFDINGDGKDELLLFTEASKDKPNEYSPMDVYTLDKNNKVVRITPEFVNGERTTLSITKEKAFHVYGSGGAKVHGYTFYKLINDGTALEKTDDFSFDANVNSKEYERHYPVDKIENIPVDQFKEKVINKNNYIKFDFSKRKSIFDFKA
ncbi:MAG: hypothetical protein E6510_03240 [Gemella haemolysans]|uniref:hypothetical protein n=1 Tax=Gemella haemolysans TaxID=1379 RepID=UPI00290AA319|nr:hypothetical protein [Gemella haemolysans]MDU6573210.1 hypothetical protein [Gemella haemolysans]